MYIHKIVLLPTPYGKYFLCGFGYKTIIWMYMVSMRNKKDINMYNVSEYIT